MSTKEHRLQSYQRYGLFGGLIVGALSGLIAAGPHLRGSPWGMTVLIVGGSTVLGAFVGYAAVGIFVGSLIRGDVGIDRGSSDGGNGEGDRFDSHSDDPGHHDSASHSDSSHST